MLKKLPTKVKYAIGSSIILLGAALIIIQFFFTPEGSYDVFENFMDNISVSNDSAVSKPQIAIIIDDFGQNREGVKEMMEVDRPLTFAVMPFLPFSQSDARKAHEKGFEVILHLPMQSQSHDKPKWIGPRPVTLSLQDDEIKTVVTESINDIPYAVGANIHMGAKTSENEHIMTCVMSVMKENGMYFVDSRTSRKTVCRQTAKSVGIRFTERNVFLEHASRNKSYIRKQLSTAADIAIQNGLAVVIGHVGTEGGKATAEVIKEMIPQLEEKGVEFVFVSQVVR